MTTPKPHNFRRPRADQRVDVYWNLTRKCFSIRDSATGQVIDYTAHVMLSHVEFNVNEAGRQRVLATGQKNVHAWASGYVVSYKSLVDEQGLQPLNIWQYKQLSVRYITYNPRKYNWFVRADKTQEPVLVVDRLHCGTILDTSGKPRPELMGFREDYWNEFNYRCRLPYDVMTEQGYAWVPTTSQYWSLYKELERGGIVWSQCDHRQGIEGDAFFWQDEPEVSKLNPNVLRFGYNGPWGFRTEDERFEYGFASDSDAYAALLKYAEQL